MGDILLAILLFVLFVIPFTYIIVVDIIEISKRFHEFFSLRLRPAVVTIVNNIVK